MIMIWKYEVNKILKNPMIWVLLCFFFALNGLLIWTNLNDCWTEIRQTSKLLNQDGLHAIHEDYYNKLLSQYDSLDMIALKEYKQELYNYHGTGLFQEFIDTNYEKLQKRVEEIKENGEAGDLMYPGQIYRLHTKLYVKIIRPLLLEMGLLIMLCILFLMDDERVNKTTDLVYSSNMGRTIQKKKWFCGLLSGLGISAMLMLVTLGTWFCLVPYKGFWKSSVSSALAMEPRGIIVYPFITYEKMTMLEYLMTSIFFCFLLLIILGILTGVMQFLLKNSYFSVLAIVLLLLGTLYGNTISFGNVLDLILSWNLSYLWSTNGAWFMENNLFDSFQGAIVVNVGVQLLVLVLLWQLLYKKFQRTDC